MRFKLLYIKNIIFIIGLLSTNISFGQDFSNKGREFWVGYGSHVSMYSNSGVPVATGGTQNMVLYFTSDQDADVTVEIPSTGWTRTYKVIANQVTTSDIIPKSGSDDVRLTDEGLFAKGIHVISNVGIIAYAHIYNGSISGASLLFPVSTLSRDYYSLNYTQVSNSNYSYCYAYVIATEDGTNIEIIPSANTLKNSKGDTIRVVLKKGEIYNIMGKLNTSTNPFKGEDLTGTRIRSVATSTSSCKRIAVYSGSGKLSLTCTAGSGSADNYMQQAFPSSAWGRKYLTAPTNKMPNNFFRIAVSDAAAIVKVDGVILAKSSLINNFYYEYASTTPNKIESDKPIMVAQYITTANSCGNNIIGGNGDPEMIYLSPIEQTIKKVTINSTNNAIITSHYINIIIPKLGLNSLIIDGVKPSGSVKHPADTNYYYLQFTSSVGSHTIISDSGFNAIAYGYGSAESYGYNAGANVVDLYQFLEVNNNYNTVYLPITCKGVTSKASITLPYKPLSLKWNIPNYPKDSVYNPIPDDSTLVNGKMVYKYSYKTPFSFNATGQYLIQVLANNPTVDGCSGEQDLSFYLTVSAPPKTKDSIYTTHCLSDSVSLFDKTIVSKDDRPIIKYMWDFGNGIFKDTTPNINFKADTAGRYNIRHFVINDIGCLSDTLTADSSILQLVLIDSVPKIKFSISDTTCINTNLTLRDATLSTPFASLKNWVWNYGDGSTLDSVNNNQPRSHVYSELKEYRPILSLETLNGCIVSDSIRFTNRPYPTVGFAIPDGCLYNAFATFSDTSSIVDQTNNFKYLWNFNDAASNNLNPNTAINKTPTHKFSSAGNYDIILQVASQYGCVSVDTSIFTVLGAIPHPNFKILNDQKLCTNQDVAIQNLSNIDFGNIEKIVIYWDNDNGTSDSTVDLAPILNKIYNYRYINYNFPNKMRYNIRMKAISGLSCKADTIIQANLIPHPKVGYILPEVCLADSYAEFLDTTKIDDNSTNKFIYKWNFNVIPPINKKLPTILPAAYTTKNPRVKYNDFADYVVSLKVTQSETGCMDSLASTFTVNGAIPHSSFRVIRDTALCTNDSVRIENLSTVDFGTIGKLIIYWDVNKLTDTTLDEFPYFGKKYAHKYTGYKYPNKMSYTIRMLASSGGICADDTTNNITLVSSPIVGFRLPSGCLQNAIANFSDTSKIDDNTNNFKYLWNFGDMVNNIDVNKNTSHTYSSSKTYNVKLVVTSLKGCVDSSNSQFKVNGSIPKSVFSIIKDTALCSNEFVKISDSSWTNFGIMDTVKISWGDGTADTIIKQPQINTIYQHNYSSFSVPNNLNFTIKLSSISGLVCNSSVSKTIKIIPPPNLPIISTPKNFLCLYDSLPLSSNTSGGAPPFSGIWKTINTNAKIIDSTIYGLVAGNTGISLELTDQKKCIYPFDNIFQIPVFGIPTAIIAAVDTVICNGDSVVITGQGANTYKWYRNDTLFYSNQVGQISVGLPGIYKLVVNDGSCNSLKSNLLTISLLNIPRYTFSTKLDACIGVPLIINTSAIEQNKIHFKWFFGDGTSSFLANPGSHKYASNGIYRMYLNVTNDWCPKYAYQVSGNPIKVVSPLSAKTYTLYLYPNLDTMLMSKSDPGYTKYNWSPITYLSDPTIPRPIFKGDKSIIFTLTRTDTVTSCNIYDEYDINVSPDIYLNVPNAFTPNNDGLNDILKIEYGAGISSFTSFKIFNRWGILVFQTNEITKGWNGRDLNGVLQEMDAYSYFAEYSYNDFFKNVVVPVKKTGSIILIR